MDSYGKKRKSFFSKGRDAEPSSKQKKEKDRSGFRTFHDSQSHPSHHDSRFQPLLHESRSQPSFSSYREEQDSPEDSIDDLASKLLDDTTVEQSGASPGRRLSQIGLDPGNSGMSAPRIFEANDNNIETKNLPQLPSMLFNGDDAWAMKGSPVVTSANCANFTQFVDEPDNPLAPPTRLKNTSTHSRNASTPTIPRKSSKRKSKRAKSNIASPKKPSRGGATHSRTLSKSISTPMLLSNTNNATNVGLDINDKIANMLAATAALKGPPPHIDGKLLQGSLAAPKKKSVKENNAFIAKVKSLGAIFRKKRDPLHGPLLDAPLITDGEIRLNEGKNLENREKTANLTGRRKINIARKPIADDGKSLKSRKSNDKENPFSDHASLGQRRMTTSDLDYYNFGAEDSDEDIESGEDGGNGEDNNSADELMIPELPPMPRSLATMPNLMKSMTSDLAYTRSNNTMLSSPPLDESTPRLRLEPFIKNGRKMLKSVPVDSHSFFDADASIGSPSSHMNVHRDPIINCFEDDQSHDELTIETNPRRASKLGYADFNFTPSSRRKKHPSPSKDALNGWAVDLDKCLRPNVTPGAGAFTADAKAQESCVLAPRDPNRASYYSEHSQKSSIGLSHQSVPSLTRLSTHRQSLGSITGSPRRTSRHSIISISRQSETHGSQHSSKRNSRVFGIDHGSELEIDELQDPAYDHHRMRI